MLEIVLWIIGIWIAISIPVGFVAARFVAIDDENPFEDDEIELLKGEDIEPDYYK
jgi:hypothetical protein